MASGYSRLPDESIRAGGGGQRSYGTVDANVGFAPAPKSGTEFYQVCTYNMFLQFWKGIIYR